MSVIKGIVGFFQAIIDIILSLINLIQMAGSFFGSIMGFLPPEIVGTFALLVSVCLIYKLLGRENQS